MQEQSSSYLDVFIIYFDEPFFLPDESVPTQV